MTFKMKLKHVIISFNLKCGSLPFHAITLRCSVYFIVKLTIERNARSCVANEDTIPTFAETSGDCTVNADDLHPALTLVCGIIIPRCEENTFKVHSLLYELHNVGFMKLLRKQSVTFVVNFSI